MLLYAMYYLLPCIGDAHTDVPWNVHVEQTLLGNILIGDDFFLCDKFHTCRECIVIITTYMPLTLSHSCWLPLSQLVLPHPDVNPLLLPYPRGNSHRQRGGRMTSPFITAQLRQCGDGLRGPGPVSECKCRDLAREIWCIFIAWGRGTENYRGCCPV